MYVVDKLGQAKTNDESVSVYCKHSLAFAIIGKLSVRFCEKSMKGKSAVSADAEPVKTVADWEKIRAICQKEL